VRFVGFGYRVPKNTFGYKEFTLSTKWQRFEETSELPPKLPKRHSVGVEILGGQDAKIWLDGFQLERGEHATEFDP
jgi:hypothetical protein